MISRRALLGTGAGAVGLVGAVVVADATHRLDDIARAIGIEPRPQPVVSDDALIAEVAKEQNVVLAGVEAVAARHPTLRGTLAPFTKIAQAHVTAVGGSSTVPRAEPVDADVTVALGVLATIMSSASTARAKNAQAAVSPDLARALSSMAAGLAQCARAVRTLA